MKIYNGADESKIVLIRPGATEFDEQGRIIGTLDIPLSELGREQAESLAKESADYDVKAIYSSPDLAATQTAEILGAQHSRKIKIKDALRNIDMGLWQGKEIEELRATQPKVARQWEEHPETVCAPDGESVEDALPRVQKFLLKLRKKHKTGTVVIIAADPLAKVVESLLKRESSEAEVVDRDSSKEVAASGEINLLPLSVETSKA